MNEREDELWKNAMSEVNFDPQNLPIFIRTPHIISGFTELTEAIYENHSLGLIDDNQQQSALLFVEKLRLSANPEADLAEIGYVEAYDGTGEKIILIPAKDTLD